MYRPPSWEIDVGNLRTGDPYPGQPGGLDLRVDQSDNLRTDDGALVPAPHEFVSTILDRNSHRRARRTPAGHLIVRVDSRGSDEADWRYVGTIDLPDESDAAPVTRLRLRASSGKRVIAREDESKTGVIHFALGPDASGTKEGGQARDRLLEWVRRVEAERSITIREIVWDNETRYWLEIGGDRIPYDGPLAPLEFKT